MENVKVIEVNEDIFANNNSQADETRKKLKEAGTFMLNVMSSPGSGKTTTISEIVNVLKGKYKILVLDVDIESSLDAETVAKKTGVTSIQIHNGGLCHIDADMTSRALKNIDVSNYDLIILENIGNLVCPAEFDTGATKNMMLLSIPEGDDKPLKYPLMFSVCDVVLFSKIDVKEVFKFDTNLCKEHIKKLNKDVTFFNVSAKTGDGIKDVATWLENQIKIQKKGE